MQDQVDITLVAGARPDLLRRTLDSFDAGFFQGAPLGTVYANVDLWGGDQAARAETVDLLRARFTRVETRQPEQPGFGAAVKWLWAQPRAPHFLHLEDDWLLRTPLRWTEIAPLFAGNTRQVSLMTRQKYWRHRYPFHVMRRWVGVGPVQLWARLERERPIFTTSPAFLERNFAHECAARMRADMDPEKQLYGGPAPGLFWNPDLATYTAPYANRLFGKWSSPPIEDIGRDWRKARNLEKHLVDGKSVWRSP